MGDLIQTTENGLYCPEGDFYIDPWRPVPRAVITHAHSDHARPGCGRYLTTHAGRHVLQIRMGREAPVDTVAYGESLSLNGVHVSLHPAGHILGSAQVRVSFRGEQWVVSGDYKVTPDATCATFESVRCHTFVTECTFGLPIYRWPSQVESFDEIDRWWRRNRDDDRVSVIFAYALGKAQRVLAGVDTGIGPIYGHGAVMRVSEGYRSAGVSLPSIEYAGRGDAKTRWKGGLVIAPPSAMGSTWLRKFGDPATAFVSGWMRLRGTRRRRSVERGFVLSDHADWPGLLAAIQESGAERILATHGQTGPMVRYLRELGMNAAPLRTEFIGERDDLEVDAEGDETDPAPDNPEARREANS